MTRGSAQFVDLPALESEQPAKPDPAKQTPPDSFEAFDATFEITHPGVAANLADDHPVEKRAAERLNQLDTAQIETAGGSKAHNRGANRSGDGPEFTSPVGSSQKTLRVLPYRKKPDTPADQTASRNSLKTDSRTANNRPAMPERDQADEDALFRLSSSNQGQPHVPFTPIPTERKFDELPPLSDSETSRPQKLSNHLANPNSMIRAAVKPANNGYVPWWIEKVSQSERENAKRITVTHLVLSLLRNSPEIRAISQDPIIASTFIETENAKFDPTTFLESKWEDTSEPVGNILTTNNSAFLKDHIITGKAGFRKKTHVGTEVELSQSIGFKNSNSEFFQPQDQGTARLELNVNQPLLNGAGKLVGTSRILLAELDSQVAGDQYAEQLQEKIVAVIKAYWELHFQRSVYVLREKNHQSALKILHRLKGRESFDAQRGQIIRAEVAVAARKLDLIRSRTDVQNAETVIRELTRDQALGPLGLAHHIELLPSEAPQVNPDLYPSLAAVVTVAYQNRPEIDQAMKRLKAASIQNDVSKNQLLPQLSFVLKAYSAALNGDSGIERALVRQLASTTPGYSAGLVFEYPLYNRAAQARKQRVEAELTKLAAELEDTMGNITAEVEIAYREQKLALESTTESLKSIRTAEKDQAFIQKRWENSAFLESQEFSSPTIFLEQLLDSQDRITQAQIQYANATKQFMVASAEIRKAEGSLLNYQELDPAPEPVVEPQMDNSIAPLSDDVSNQ